PTTLGAALAAGALYLLRGAAPVRASARHSAAEGIAIGAAMALGRPFGLVLALTLVVHNVGEGAVLGVALGGRGRGAAVRAATLARAGQVAFALVTAAVVDDARGALPLSVGAGFGALLFLLFAELLPESYRVLGRTGIAIAVCLAAGMVALLGGGARGGAP
ncbi:hypothetical protein PYV61_22770, partial [Roseisolibacter sp. H3M3-2]